MKTFDATEYGGAPLLGLNGLVVKTHGSAKAKEVTNTIIQCVTFKQQNISEKIKASNSGGKKLPLNNRMNKQAKGDVIMEFEKLKKIIAEVCDVDEDKITMDSTFKDDLDADSLDVFQIVTAIEDEFELEISDEDAEKIVTVGDAVEQIQNATGNN